MDPKSKVVEYMKKAVGGVAGPMVERHVKAYLEETGKDTFREEDIPDFGKWLSPRLTHIATVNPGFVKKIPEDFQHL